MFIPVELKKMIADNYNNEMIMGWDDELDYVDVTRDTEFNLYLGSRVNSVSLRPYHPGNINFFKYGFCSIFSYVVHDFYQYPLVVMNSSGEGSSWSGHTVNKVGDVFLDIEGLKVWDNIVEEYGIVSSEVVDLDRFDNITRARKFFNNLPLFEKSVINHVVEAVLLDNNLIP